MKYDKGNIKLTWKLYVDYKFHPFTLNISVYRVYDILLYLVYGIL